MSEISKYNKVWEEILRLADETEIAILDKNGALKKLKDSFICGHLDKELFELFSPIDKMLDSEDSKNLRCIRGKSRLNRKLTQDETNVIYDAASKMGIDTSLLVFNKSTITGYSNTRNKIYVFGDIFPNPNSSWLTDQLSVQAVLAHEYYHYKNRDTKLKIGSVIDEFRASWQAHESKELNLNDIDRLHLKLDAYCRLFRIDIPMRLVNFLSEGANKNE
jgi:hypothetical protein